MGHSKIKTPQIETARGKRATKRATKRAQNKATTSVAKVAHHEAVVQNTVSVEAVVESIPISEELPLNENNSDLLFEDSIEGKLISLAFFKISCAITSMKFTVTLVEIPNYFPTYLFKLTDLF